ncbi:hypothetical protein KAM344_27690 [Aeromonas caviae]|uniref:Uncharacterized protein n=2 Tax=Gammaproteobacteria TaxID=1236 RepID=A0A649Z4D9_PSEAI|nr:hypothetical protein [Pseudomonas aeruginosa]BDA20504.1 hypothetical protein KAM345_044180 [Aeromonas caviae]BDO10844.1 hypothetical protein KAM643c_44170 [Aeromonas caviae]GJA15941.1 hypothetical protein KAM335_31370 [Aeromonas caviae]GJA19960.1 hypothetical protein KAM336_29810 [Aeromonas caviae]
MEQRKLRNSLSFQCRYPFWAGGSSSGITVSSVTFGIPCGILDALNVGVESCTDQPTLKLTTLRFTLGNAPHVADLAY